jgi:hypothetical protein
MKSQTISCVLPSGAEGHVRLVAKNIRAADVVSRVDGRRADRRAAVHEILGDFGLPVDHHRLAGQLLERDAMAHAVDADLHAFVHEAVFVHARADAGFVEQDPS